MYHVWATGFLWRNLKERGHLEDVGVDGQIMLKGIFKEKVLGIDWINVAMDRDK
jgi:hypothetical protein